jgi:nucleoside-diphosphate-sugar epimerase
MAQARVLVTGAGGFIGHWSVPALHALGYEVHAVLAPNAARSVPAELIGANLHRVDLLDATATDALVAMLRPTHLLHFAWIATPGLYWISPENYRWLEAGRHLLQSFLTRGGVRAVMAGSCAEYDWTRAAVCREDSSPLADTAAAPPAAYPACKIAMQRSLEMAGRQHGASTAWGRIFFQFGPGEHPDRLVPSVVRSLLAGREALCTQGTQVRSFLHVADVGAAFAALLDSQLQGAVNIGAAERMTIATLIAMIAAQIGRPDLVRLGARTAPSGEPAMLVPDIARLQRELGWSPRYDLPGGLADTIAWWRGQPPQRAPGQSVS